MSFEIKCKCNVCGENIAFDLKQDGVTVACPHCQCETVLFVPPSDEAKRVAKLREEKRIIAPRPPAPPVLTEDSLDNIGSAFFTVGLIGMVFSFIGALVACFNEDFTAGIILACAAIGLWFQGFIIKTVFRGAAEMVRLLRKISNQ